MPGTHLDAGEVFCHRGTPHGYMPLGRYPRGADVLAVAMAADFSRAGFASAAVRRPRPAGPSGCFLDKRRRGLIELAATKLAFAGEPAAAAGGGDHGGSHGIYSTPACRALQGGVPLMALRGQEPEIMEMKHAKHLGNTTRLPRRHCAAPRSGVYRGSLWMTADGSRK